MMSIVVTGARPTRKDFSTTKGTLVVALALLALLALAALIPASEAKNAEHSYVAASTPDQSGSAASVSSELAASQMSEEEALDAFRKLPLSFITQRGPNR